MRAYDVGRNKSIRAEMNEPHQQLASLSLDETTRAPRCSTLLCGGKPAWKRNTRPDWTAASTEYKCQTCYERNRHWADDFDPKWMRFVKISSENVELRDAGEGAESK